MDDQNKNLLLATALSMVVILVWFLLFPPPDPVEDPNAPAATDTDSPAAVGDVASAPDAAPATPGDTTASTTVTSEAARVPLDTARLDGSISLTGGRIDDLRLKDYHVELSEESPTVQVLDPVGSENAYYALYGWAPGAGLGLEDVPGANTPWSVASGDALSVGSPVTLRWESPAGLVFTRKIA